MDRFRLKRELIVLELSKGVILLTAELIAELCISELHQSSNCWKLVQELYFSCFKELSKRMILSSLIKFFICEYFFHRRCHRSLKLGRPVQLKIRTIVFFKSPRNDPNNCWSFEFKNILSSTMSPKPVAKVGRFKKRIFEWSFVSFFFSNNLMKRFVVPLRSLQLIF